MTTKVRSIRLTGSVRDGLLSNLLKVYRTEHGAAELAAELQSLASQLFDQAAIAKYGHVYGDYTRAEEELLAKGVNPRYRFDRMEWLMFVRPSFRDLGERGGTQTESYHMTMKPRVLDGAVDLAEGVAKGELRAGQVDEFVRKLKLEKKLSLDIKELTTQAKAVLASVSTTKQLTEVWPEVTPYLDPYLRDESKQRLPMATANKINGIMGWN